MDTSQQHRCAQSSSSTAAEGACPSSSECQQQMSTAQLVANLSFVCRVLQQYTPGITMIILQMGEILLFIWLRCSSIVIRSFLLVVDSQSVQSELELVCAAVGTSFSAFGIFDGHGGKPAATYASKELLPNVMKLVDRWVVLLLIRHILFCSPYCFITACQLLTSRSRLYCAVCRRPRV